MIRRIKKLIYEKFFTEFGSSNVDPNRYSDIETEEKNIIERVQPFTLTNQERLVSLIRSIKYLENNRIDGSIVECGVWKGGSIMAALSTLDNLNSYEREVFLYDTFEGMNEPTELDRTYKGESALKAFLQKDLFWKRIKCDSTLEEVEKNIKSINYPEKKIKFIKGKVEDTIPDNTPEKIALLRLDTDWYESTFHELKYLYPRLVKGGILIIDDYGHWKGCKAAVDRYFADNGIQMFLNRVDYTCRLGIKK